jgi:NADH-quinone oxidoreductase subunit C
MTPEELAARFTHRYGDEVAIETAYGLLTVDVPARHWIPALAYARDELDCRFFDWLSAVDELDEGFSVVAHLWSVVDRHHLLVRTRVPRDDPRLPTATGVFAGASWHERETHEMFGVEFTGGVAMDILLLPEDFEGHPLRKDFVLASRVAQPWPGAKEPGESDSSHAQSAPARRTMRPPGVPEPAVWGPRAPGSPAPDPLAAAVPTAPTRPRRERRTAEAAPPAPPAASPDPGPSPTDGGDG